VGTAAGALGSARSLVRRSGAAGVPVIVWSPRTGAERGWLRAEATVLRSIGYAARVVTVPDARFRSEITSLVPRPVSAKTGAGSSSVRPLLAHHGVKTSSRGPLLASASAVVGGRLTREIRVPVEDAVPIAISADIGLSKARGAHLATFAEQTVPELMSWRMDEPDAVIDPVEGLDLTSLRLR
jgi:hypothetical protein